ncbi:hypothetical protein YC2023_014466 [Brassica napus]
MDIVFQLWLPAGQEVFSKQSSKEATRQDKETTIAPSWLNELMMGLGFESLQPVTVDFIYIVEFIGVYENQIISNMKLFLFTPIVIKVTIIDFPSFRVSDLVGLSDEKCNGPIPRCPTGVIERALWTRVYSFRQPYVSLTPTSIYFYLQSCAQGNGNGGVSNKLLSEVALDQPARMTLYTTLCGN